MTQLAKEEDLNHLSFLREISVLKEQKETELKTKKTKELKDDLAPNTPKIQEKLTFLNIPFKPILSDKLQEEVAETFSAVPSQKSTLSMKEAQDLIFENPVKRKWDFQIPFLNKRKKVQVKYVSNKQVQIPVVEKEITSSHQIVDSRSLLVFSSSWIKTIFENKILFKAIPATGTNLLIFPKGHYFFVQFAYQATPIHPTQEMIHQKLSPLKVLVFRDFKSFRNWVYEQMREIEGENFNI